MEGLLLEEAETNKAREEETKREADEEKKLKEKSKEKLIDDLMFGEESAAGADGEEGDAAAIVAKHEREAQERIAQIRNRTTGGGGGPKFSTGIDVRSGSTADIGPAADGVPYTYMTPDYLSDGPVAPDSHGHLSFMRSPEDSERPAGFNQTLPCNRALTEAMAGLFFVVENSGNAVSS